MWVARHLGCIRHTRVNIKHINGRPAKLAVGKLDLLTVSGELQVTFGFSSHDQFFIHVPRLQPRVE